MSSELEKSGKFGSPCPTMGAKCNHSHPDYCKQAALEATAGYKGEMARRAAFSGVFSHRRDTSGGNGDSLSRRFTTDASGVVQVTGPAPEESESVRASKKLLKDHSNIQI
jgi:hypothetical protein